MTEEKKELMAEVEIDNGKGGVKKVVLKLPQISHSELAAQRAGAEADPAKNAAHFSLVSQRELVKICLVSIDGDVDVKKPMDELFSVAEYNDVGKTIGELGGQTGKRKKPVVSFL